jgi:hypothetical protein
VYLHCAEAQKGKINFFTQFTAEGGERFALNNAKSERDFTFETFFFPVLRCFLRFLPFSISTSGAISLKHRLQSSQDVAG